MSRKYKLARPLCRLVSLCIAFAACVALAGLGNPATQAADWPQWRGPNHDARITGFTAPQTWPKELTQKWKVTVGDGVATPALVGDKIYVFSREGGSEVTRCLEAATGKEVWIDKYDTPFMGRADGGFPGPRSSVAVADGVVVTLGVNGVVSGLEAASGKKLWRHDNTGAVPGFHTSSSPLIVDGLAIAQVGNDRTGSVVAYELMTGKEKWKWGSEGTAYASPTVMTVDGTKMVVAETMQNIVGIGVADGKLLWKTPFALSGKGGGNYNSSTPTAVGSTVVFSGSGRGTRAVKVEKSGTDFKAKEQWSNKDYSVVYNSPIVRDGMVYGLTGRNALYAVSAESGKKAWDHDLPSKGGKGGGGGYGSIVDAGSVLFALTPGGRLMVFEPSDKEYKEVVSYPVGSRTYAYPIISGKNIYIKDANSIAMYAIE